MAHPSTAALGRLGPPLVRLAEAQQQWPPRLTAGPLLRPGAGFDDGTAAADRAADEGQDLILLDPDREPPAATCAAAALLGLDPVGAVGLQPAPDWAERVRVVREGLPACRGLLGEPDTMLRTLDDPDLAWLTGVLTQAAVRGLPVLFGGPAATSALVAGRLCAGGAVWWLPADVPAAPAGRAALAELGATAVLDLGLPGAGGARLALGLLQAALRLLTDLP